jgi:hypothetical protein
MTVANSLLFIISALKAFFSSKLLLWKISNALLVPAYYLCIANDFSAPYVLYNHAAIFFICSSYINSVITNCLLFASLIFEYKLSNRFILTNGVSFAIALSKSIYNTYFYTEIYIYNDLVASVIIGAFVYIIICLRKDKPALLTLLFHFCIMIIMYISSFTA